MFEIFRKELMWGGRRLVLETGRIARQADGAVLVTYGETTVLCTAVATKTANFSNTSTAIGLAPLIPMSKSAVYHAPTRSYHPCDTIAHIWPAGWLDTWLLMVAFLPMGS